MLSSWHRMNTLSTERTSSMKERECVSQGRWVSGQKPFNPQPQPDRGGPQVLESFEITLHPRCWIGPKGENLKVEAVTGGCRWSGSWGVTECRGTLLTLCKWVPEATVQFFENWADPASHEGRRGQTQVATPLPKSQPRRIRSALAAGPGPSHPSAFLGRWGRAAGRPGH